jgi:hypothetical protein
MPTRVSSTTPWHIRPVALAGAGIGALTAVTALLWVHYGSAVFFEMLAAGFASCF